MTNAFLVCLGIALNQKNIYIFIVYKTLAPKETDNVVRDPTMKRRRKKKLKKTNLVRKAIFICKLFGLSL